MEKIRKKFKNRSYNFENVLNTLGYGHNKIDCKEFSFLHLLGHINYEKGKHIF